MFAFSFIQGLKIPSFKTVASGTVCDYMFLFAHSYDYGSVSSEFNATKENKGLDFSGCDFKNTISAKGMFLGYNFVLPSNLIKEATLKFGTNNFSNVLDVS